MWLGLPGCWDAGLLGLVMQYDVEILEASIVFEFTRGIDFIHLDFVRDLKSVGMLG